jgi:hypothetical protein
MPSSVLERHRYKNVKKYFNLAKKCKTKVSIYYLLTLKRAFKFDAFFTEIVSFFERQFFQIPDIISHAPMNN